MQPLMQSSEKRRRIVVAVWAMAYEVFNKPLASDAEFDALAYSIDASVDTDRSDLDKWFRENFTPYTGSWIHTHPDYSKIKQIAERLYHAK